VSGAADLADLPRNIEELFDHIRIEVDVLATPEPRIRIYLDADEVCDSSGAAGAFECRSGWSLAGPPLIDWSAAEIVGGLAYACDPDGGVDGPDADDIVDNDCGLGSFLGVIGVACPVLGRGRPGDCNPLENLMEQLDDLRTYLSRLVVTLNGVHAGWGVGEAGEPDLRLMFDVGVDIELGSIEGIGLESIVDLEFTYAQGGGDYRFGIDDRHCPASLECHGPVCSPGVLWRGFLAAGDEVSWTTWNLEVGEARPIEGFAWDWSIDWQPWVDGLTRIRYAALLPDLEEQARTAFEALFDGASRTVRSLVAFVPAQPLDPLLARFAFCDLDPEATCGFEFMRNGADIEPVPPLFPDGLEMPPAPPVALRLIETAVGASRTWWSAVGDPLTWLDEYASGARFEFVGITAQPVSPSGWTAVAELESDLDCDAWADHRDGCPTQRGSFPDDLDGDGVGDGCDLCQSVHRGDRVVPRRSHDYAAQAPAALGTLDSDADGIGDRCDLCEQMAIRPSQDRFDEEALVSPWGPTFTGQDFDHDGFGDDCDNCPNHPNRDQWNCNWRDELLRSSLADPPVLGRVGLGDACDPYPCVDSCAAPYERPELKVGRDESSPARPFFPTAELAVCPVGKDPDDDSAVGRIDTRVRGCYCSEGERLLGLCDEICPNNGALGVRPGGVGWRDASYPAVPRDPATGDILPTTYDYKRLYRDEDWRGLTGERFDLAGYRSFYEPVGRKTIQTWNWRDDVCGPSSADWEGCEQYIQMWFKPQVTARSWFDAVRFGPYGDREGNTYTEGQVWVDADGNAPPSGLPDFRELPFGAGGGSATGLTIPWLVDDRGRISRNTGTLVDILRVRCFAMGGPCPWWPDRLFFDSMGSEVAGVAVSAWSTVSDSVGWTIGSRLPAGAAFDLLEPSIAVTHDLNGDPYRYWMFGGVDAGSGEATDQMWGARLATIDGSGAVVYDDGSGLAFPLRNAAPPDPATTFFDLSPLPRTNIWPSPRVGAVLACAGASVVSTGPGTSIEQACNGLCPKLDVVLGLNDPPDGIIQPAGALILVGGEGPEGPLDDIWRYEEVATWQPPSDVPIGDVGPWPSGWRLTGVLPGVAGGLSAAGTVQVGRSLWLVGGRTDAGPTSDVYRVDLDTGTAVRVEAAGWPGGPARVAPAVTYDVARRQLVVFGGVDAANTGRADLWVFDPAGGTWSQLVPECTGNGCPPATGREKLVLSEIDGQPTVIADRGTSVPGTASWTLREGAWVAAGERIGGAATIDCDGDTAIEARFGLRCSTGSGGFPDYGRLRCEGAGLACRPPMLPGQVVHEYRMPHVRALAARGEELLALQGRDIDVHRIGADGALAFDRSLRLSRAAHDIAVAGDTLLVADGRGVSLLRANDGGVLGELDFCGRVRRVFADGSRAYVVGLFQVLMVDISDPTAPVVLQRIGLLPERDGGLRVYSAGDCGRVDALLDRLCDATGACGAFGRAAAAYDGGRLFLHLFGTLHVLTLREDLGADVLASLPVGLLTELAVDGRFVYGNGPGHRTTVIGEVADGSWISAGEHDVTSWVSGVVSVGPWVVRAEPGRVQVATRQ
jgi:hypothetical protein